MTNQYFLARIAGRDPNIRASDEERERIAERLRKSHAEGRLDMSEFQERLERCYEAKTLGQLSELVKDLPRQPEPERTSSPGWLHPARWRLAPLALIVIALLLISAVSGHEHHGFWLWIPLVFLVWRMSWWRRRRHWASGRGSDDWL